MAAHLTPGENLKLVVAISSRTLFDLHESHAVFQKDGVQAYRKYQIEHEDEPLEPGVAFPMVKKLLSLNAANPADPLVEVILLSRNSADTGLRVFKSVRHHGLDITRAVFSGGNSPYRYVSAFGAHLFLSAEPDDARAALDANIAAATILPSTKPMPGGGSNQLRIAFDGDAVIFSDEAERVYKDKGLAAFNQSEVDFAAIPLSSGPFMPFLAALNRIQSDEPEELSPIRTALITARGAPAHERAIRTLRAWGIRIDEAIFLGGMSKGAFLKAFGADIFFDDQKKHCESARQFVATGHVPNGIANQNEIQSS